jgi:DNA-binding FadR family transcriptional regulator
VSSFGEQRVLEALGDVTPVITRGAAAQIADQLVLAVRERRLQPNDRLPSERDLALRFGVSRPTIREALTGLELAGIVETQKGRGTIIIGTSSLVAMWGVQMLPPQIFEARLAIEPELARLAAIKRYPEDIADLYEVLSGLESAYAARGTYEDDFPIHRAIARASRNPILERALEDALVYTQTRLWSDLTQRAFVTEEVRVAHHREAVETVRHIEQGDADAAAGVWRQHLMNFRDEMLGRAHGPATNHA